MNNHSIGIELLGIGTWEDMSMFMDKKEDYDRIKKEDLGFTDPQYVSLKWLLEKTLKEYNVPNDRCHIIGHNEWAPSRRTDPGHLFYYERIGLPQERKPNQCL